MAEMIDLPAALFGSGSARSVPADSLVRLELRVPAPLFRELVLKSNHSGVPMAKIVTAELTRLMGQEG